MPTKTDKDSGKTYKVDGKKFTWTTEDGDTVELPMRIKMRVLRAVGNGEMDAAAMFNMIEAIAPNQTDALDEMDVNEFTQMFSTWQVEYNALTGASLGE